MGLSCCCFSSAPAIEASRVENVLVPCAYSPTYVVKDFPIARYQGLQFVSASPWRGRGHAPVRVTAKPPARARLFAPIKTQEDVALTGGSSSA